MLATTKKKKSARSVGRFGQGPYRNFLKNNYEDLKSSNPAFNLTKFAQRIGLGSSFLRMVLSNRRDLSLDQIHCVAKALRLSPAEWSCFEAWVLRDQANENLTRNYYDIRLRETRKNLLFDNTIKSNKELIGDSLTPTVVLYLLDILNISPDADISDDQLKEMTRSLGIERSRLNQIIKQIRHVKFEEKPNQKVKFDHNLHLAEQKSYLNSWLKEAAMRLDTEYANKKSLFNAVTLSLPNYEKLNLERDLKQLLDKYLAINLSDLPANRRDDVSIVQLNYQLLQITKSQLKNSKLNHSLNKVSSETIRREVSQYG